MAGMEKARERAWRREVREVAGTEGGPLIGHGKHFLFSSHCDGSHGCEEEELGV